MSNQPFTEPQKQYISGLAMGVDVARAVRGLPILSDSAAANGTSIKVGKSPTPNFSSNAPSGPERIAYDAQQRTLEAGKKLCNEEKAKAGKNALDMWDELTQRSQAGVFPKGTDLFLTKFHGMFYVAPAQDAYMCRLRVPGGELYAQQLIGLADLADRSAGGYIDITTRANLQLREIAANQAMDILYGVRELGLMTLGSGADNIRNVTASPLSGIDPNELIETLPIAKRMHHYICMHRELYGLPRKFNIAFDGGGTISSLEDTNDIGFHAFLVSESKATSQVPAGIYFQLALGGITGHTDFARDTGICVLPEEAWEVAGAIVRVYAEHGDRTDRKKARLKYVLDSWGFDKFIAEVERQLGRLLRRVPGALSERAEVEDRTAHVDFHAQRQSGKVYVGVVFPVGRMTSDQARGLASIAARYGSGHIRLTVWQNLLIPNIDQRDQGAVGKAIEELGLEYRASAFRAGLIACTGNAGCKFSAANTKQHALQLAEYLQSNFQLDQPINIHLTGCHHSCAQHYIGDIGLIGAKVEVEEQTVEGYDIYVGGGWGSRQGIARLMREKVPFEEVLPLVAELISDFLTRREVDETFVEFTRRLSSEELHDYSASRVIR